MPNQIYDKTSLCFTSVFQAISRAEPSELLIDPRAASAVQEATQSFTSRGVYGTRRDLHSRLGFWQGEISPFGGNDPTIQFTKQVPSFSYIHGLAWSL